MTLAERRIDKGLTQAQLADAVGSSASYIAQLESGHRRASIDLLTRLASVFGCGAGDLIDDTEREEST